jgi:two-component system response regulator LytT
MIVCVKIPADFLDAFPGLEKSHNSPPLNILFTKKQNKRFRFLVNYRRWLVMENACLADHLFFRIPVLEYSKIICEFVLGFIGTFFAKKRTSEINYRYNKKPMLMNCIIIDDDEMIRIDLEKKISGNPMLKLIGAFSSALDAADIIMKERIDLIFLDIMMPEMTGIQFLKSLSANHPQIILITSEKQFAVEAFEYEVTDYILKPVSEERFLKAVLRAAENFNASISSRDSNKYVFVRVDGNFVKIELAQILYIEALADYVMIYTTGARYTVHLTMKTIESYLSPVSFARVHNSFIVNLEKISKVEDNMVIIDQKLIPVSRARFKPLMSRLNLIS